MISGPRTSCTSVPVVRTAGDLTSAPVDEMFLIFTGDDEPSQYSEAARVSVCRVSERRSLASCRNELCINRLPPSETYTRVC